MEKKLIKEAILARDKYHNPEIQAEKEVSITSVNDIVIENNTKKAEFLPIFVLTKCFRKVVFSLDSASKYVNYGLNFKMAKMYLIF